MTSKINKARLGASIVESAAGWYRLDEKVCPQDVAILISKKYLLPTHLDPWRNHYLILCPDGDGQIIAFSRGPDGVVGTEDDVYPTQDPHRR
ncbi:MAG: type II secretion system protein GspG [Myxococcales bacterium]|nr:type II secretion system protein GspG [Myxococcales bacterium]